jgi:hypothetical protein
MGVHSQDVGALMNLNVSWLGGCLFIRGGCVLKIRECKLKNIFWLRDGGILHGENGGSD